VQAILSKILSGELKPGDRLPAERELADAMGISRSSVNHGIMELENMGFLTITPRRGTIVNDYRARPTPQSLAAVMRYSSVEMEQSLFSDLMATRLLIEGACARLACSNIYDSTFEKMTVLVDELAREPEDPTDILYRFHYLLTAASGNSIYSMIYRGFETVLCTLIRQHYSMRAEDIKESVRLHRLLLEAIKTRDADAAENLARRIITQGISVLQERYD
jgi:DNA-binding FadR family transcriptional regulator